MSSAKQVDKKHYRFLSYMDAYRWMSFWHQLEETIKLNPSSVLEIGPGPGLFKIICNTFGVNVTTLDLDPDLKPDIIGSAMSMPFDNASFDITCAFQMLEHLPYDDSLIAFSEMVRVSKKYIVISLPDAQRTFRWRVYIPGIAAFDRLYPKFGWKPTTHSFNGEHYWEINKINFALDRVIKDFSNICKLEKTYRVMENPYHRFFIFSK